MKKLLSILSVLVCFTSFSQTPYVPNNPDSLKLSVIVNNAVRSVYVTDLQKNQQSVDYLIDKIGNITTATPRKGSGLLKYTGTNPTVVIQSAINALRGNGPGTGGGHIHFVTGEYIITDELLLDGWQGGTLNSGSQITLSGDGISTKIVQQTAGKNAIVAKNAVSFVLRNLFIYTSSISKSCLLTDVNGANTELSCVRSVIDNVLFQSSSTTSPAVYLKNFFDFTAPLMTCDNTSNDGLLIEATTSIGMFYGGGTFGYLRCLGSSSPGFSGLKIKSTNGSYFNQLAFNYYMCINGYYGIYSEGLKFSHFNRVDIETPVEVPVYFTGTNSGYWSETEAVDILGGYLLPKNGGTAIINTQYSGGNSFRDVYIEPLSGTATLFSDAAQFRWSNSYELLCPTALANNYTITNFATPRITIRKADGTFINQLPSGSTVGVKPTIGDNSLKVPTTSFVKEAVDAAIGAVSGVVQVGGSLFRAYSDFVTASNDASFNTNVSGTGATITSVAISGTNQAGVIQGALGTTATGRAGVYGANNSLLAFGAGVATYEAKVRIVNLSDATNTYTLRAGFSDNVAAEPFSGLYFRYTDAINGGRIQAVARIGNNETGTAFDTGITPVAGTWYNFKIIVNAAGTSVGYYIDGNLVATATTNIATGSGNAMGYVLSAIRTVGTTAFTAWQCDYLNITYLFTVTR